MCQTPCAGSFKVYRTELGRRTWHKHSSALHSQMLERGWSGQVWLVAALPSLAAALVSLPSALHMSSRSKCTESVSESVAIAPCTAQSASDTASNLATHFSRQLLEWVHACTTLPEFRIPDALRILEQSCEVSSGYAKMTLAHSCTLGETPPAQRLWQKQQLHAEPRMLQPFGRPLP
jgi:hypothetical protein